MNNTELKKYIEKTNIRLALGYEETIFFNYGLLLGLFHAGNINKSQYKMFKKVYANEENGDLSYTIDTKGKLIKN